jgi:NAD(P)H dehydrogenase (quinone)
MTTRGGGMRIAVTGAAGRLGGEVVRLLAQTDQHEVVALARRPLPPDQVAGGIVAALADYADVDALRAALGGVDTLVLVSSDGPVAQVIVHHHNLIRAAAQSGVSHIVALSGVDADLNSPFCYAVSNGYTEQLLHHCGCSVSIARASIYTQFFAAFLARARVDGQLRLPAGDGRVSLVSHSDVARCLVHLASSSPTNQTHNITGPESLDVPALTTIAARAWHTPIIYTPITQAEYGKELAAAGEDPWWTYAYASLFASIRESRWATLSDEVTRLTGRPAVRIEEVLSALDTSASR